MRALQNRGPFYQKSLFAPYKKLEPHSAFLGACVGRSSANHFDPTLIKRLHPMDLIDENASEHEKIFSFRTLRRNRVNTFKGQ